MDPESNVLAAREARKSDQRSLRVVGLTVLFFVLAVLIALGSLFLPLAGAGTSLIGWLIETLVPSSSAQQGGDPFGMGRMGLHLIAAGAFGALISWLMVLALNRSLSDRSLRTLFYVLIISTSVGVILLALIV
jgi:hypothetical protein